MSNVVFSKPGSSPLAGVLPLTFHQNETVAKQTGRFLVGVVVVAVVRWPSEQEMRVSLASEGRPRLLLLEAGPPPVITDPLEDWIRLPIDDSEMWARLESLRQRWEAPRRPRLDDGILTWGDGWVALSPIQVRLVAPLVERFSSMVSHQSLVAASRTSEEPRRNSLDVQLHRLRRRLAPVGLVIRTVRRRGYVLEPAAGSTGSHIGA